MHSESGAPFDPDLHATLVHAKKLACLKTHYWERGGRAKRLRKYVKKRVRRHKQLTLVEVTAQLTQGGAESESRTSYICPRPTYEPAGGTSSQPIPAT